MKIRDFAGNPVEDGADVLVPITFGMAQMGKVAGISSGVGVGPEAIPHVAVMVMFHFPVQANGMVGGLIATAPAPESSLVTG